MWPRAGAGMSSGINQKLRITPTSSRRHAATVSPSRSVTASRPAWRRRRPTASNERARRHQRAEREAEPAGIEVIAPVRDLIVAIGESEERAHPRPRPADDRCERPREPHHALRSTSHAAGAGEAVLRVRELHRVDVDGDDLVVWRERHRGVSGRGDAHHAAAGCERRELDRRILVHAAEQDLALAGAGIEPAALPHRPRDRAHEPLATLAAIHLWLRFVLFLL